MERVSPIIVLFTSRDCGHCVEVRGDGIPSEKQKFSPSFIKDLLLGESGKNGKFLIEINVEERSNVSPILELNIYKCVPHTRIINQMIKEDPKVTLNEIENSEIGGDSLLRASFKRIGHSVSVDVDGYRHDALTFLYREHFIWKCVPDYINELRECFHHKRDPSDIISKIDNNYIRGQILNKTQFKNYCDNPQSFDDYIFRTIFNFDWLISNIIPVNIRLYEPYYPSWCLVSEDEWLNSIKNACPIYARPTNHFVEKTSTGSYKLVRYTSGQTISNLLDSYHKGELSLEYDQQSLPKKTYSWQK